MLISQFESGIEIKVYPIVCTKSIRYWAEWSTTDGNFITPFCDDAQTARDLAIWAIQVQNRAKIVAVNFDRKS